jgi:hypothetical protein
MSERIIFLDIDGPIIPGGAYLLDPMCSHNRIIPEIPVAIVREACKRGNAKVVFNTTHNRSWDGVDDIEVAMVKAGFPAEYIHPDTKTHYPETRRDEAVQEWLSRHPEVKDWIAFDDAKFTEADNLIWVDPDAGLHLGHLAAAMKRWSGRPFLVWY